MCPRLHASNDQSKPKRCDHSEFSALNIMIRSTNRVDTLVLAIKQGHITVRNSSRAVTVIAGCKPRKTLEQWRGELNLADPPFKQ